MKITKLDHLVLTVQDIDATCHFYGDILGMDVITFDNDRRALHFGDQKINLHLKGHEFEPKADHPTMGSADFCLISSTKLDLIIDELNSHGIPIEQGPIDKHGALGPMRSIYVRDPDKNLVEISNYQNT